MNDEQRHSILIVDDDKSNIDVLDHILKPLYRIFVAKSGTATLKRVTSDKPDLILLDILMPDMSGFDVLLALKEMEEVRRTPVIFITGLNSVEDEEKGFLLGAVDYITKPFNNSIVKARVKTHLQIVRQIRTIERLGMVDALTDIPNRRCFDTQIHAEWGRAIRENTPISLLMMDVDKFKNYNDTYGHPQGDVLLQTVAGIIAGSVKRPTDLIARIGGEEFAAILPNTDADGAVNVAETVRARVEATKVPAEGSNFSTSATISIGVAAIRPTVNDSIKDFVFAADKALYAAKEGGRNQVCVVL